MDIKDEEGSSGGIGLEFNTDDPSQFVSFGGEEAVHLVIHPDGEFIPVPCNVMYSTMEDQMVSSHMQY